MKQPTNKKAGRKAAVAYLVSAPSLVLIFLIVVFPILYTGYISLTNMNTYHWFNFDIIGLRNYERALLVFDSGFLSALLMTVVWTAVNMVMQLVIAFLIANLLNVKHLPLRNVYKTILMFPWAMPGYVSILLWKTGMFNSEFGLLTQWMEDLSGLTVRWLQNDVSAFICCTMVNLWLALPFMIMIMDGGLKSIDRSYYESAILSIHKTRTAPCSPGFLHMLMVIPPGTHTAPCTSQTARRRRRFRAARRP